MNHNDILKQLKQGKYAPVYLLQSDEPYFVDTIVDYIESEVLDEGEKAFNQVVFYGKETEFKQILDQAMQFPMMAPYRVVIVKEAQELKDIDQLTGYIANPSEQSILVLAFKNKKVDKRKKKFWAALKKNAVILDSKRLYDNQVPAYIQTMAADRGLKIDQQATMLLTEYLGNDLAKLANEIGKLALNVEKGSMVTREHIQKYIGINKDFNIFELQKAIGMRDKPKAYRIVKYFSQNEKANPVPRNVASLYGYFTKVYIAKKYERADDRTLASKLKINPFFAREYKQAARSFTVPQVMNAFHQLHEMDKRSKGVESRNADSLGLYQEFLYKVLAP